MKTYLEPNNCCQVDYGTLVTSSLFLDTSFLYLDLLRKRSTKHQSLTNAHCRHCVLLYNTTDLGLETHVQHSIGLVQDKEP